MRPTTGTPIEATRYWPAPYVNEWPTSAVTFSPWAMIAALGSTKSATGTVGDAVLNTDTPGSAVGRNPVSPWREINLRSCANICTILRLFGRLCKKPVSSVYHFGYRNCVIECMTELDSFVTVGRSGLRGSPLSLGTMTFGENSGWGSTPEVAHAILAEYLERGGNVVDTANIYTNGHSEKIVGDYFADRAGARDRVVLS